MRLILQVLRNSVLCLAASVSLTDAAIAQHLAKVPAKAGVRTEIWLAASSWPTLSELEPAAGGSFKSFGYGIGAAAHWPLRQYGARSVLLGVEGAITATDSDVPVALDDLLARHGYVAISGKYVVGEARSFSLDVGIAYHLIDIAQLESHFGIVEFETWEETAVGAYVGVTWDPGAGRPGKDSGISLGFKVHFVDFGTVRDENIYVAPILGPDAGELLGPYYVQIGYRWR